MISSEVEAKKALLCARMLTICMSPIRLSRASMRRIHSRRCWWIRLISERCAPDAARRPARRSRPSSSTKKSGASEVRPADSVKSAACRAASRLRRVAPFPYLSCAMSTQPLARRPIIGVTLDSEPPGGYSKLPWYALRENYCDVDRARRRPADRPAARARPGRATIWR